jgi:hypothetical protein
VQAVEREKSMQRLSSDRKNEAVNFLKTQARPLEQSLYTFHFEGGSRDGVLDELSRFQNPDGGFGHGLDADLRLPDSSGIATTVAFQRLREIHAPADHPLVINGCRFLRDTYDSANVNWPIIPPNVDDAPHAPWWEYGGSLSHSKSNPRAEVAGYLYEYHEHFPDSMRQQVTGSIIEHLLALPDKIEMHDLLCYVRFYETAAVPESIKEQINDSLHRIIERTVVRDPSGWREYGLPPLSIVTRPDSAFASLFTQQELDANLDFILERQTEDSSWRPNWTWGGLHPEAWAVAEIEWSGVLTLNNLRLLRDFGWIGE